MAPRTRVSGTNGINGSTGSARDEPQVVMTPPRRRSQRLGSSATKKPIPKKSVYFAHDSEDGEDGGDSEEASSVGYGEDEHSDGSKTSPEVSEDDGEDEYNSSDDTGSRKRKRAMPKASTAVPRKAAKSQELWREGVKSELAPGEEVFIALPKARTAGKTPYCDATIHPNTLLFLGDLKRNNERPWLKLHDKDFRQSETDWKSFVDQMTARMVEVDDTIPELPAKDIIFRIYRDVRFSKDPTPYKPHFSGCWSRTGRKGPYAAYYLQIAPGRSFIGGGLWCPEAQYLALLRKDFDRRSHRIKAVLADATLRKEFLDGASNSSKALHAFQAHNAENALKRHPKGYEEENPNIGLLRLRSFTMGRKLRDEDITDPKVLTKLTSFMATLTPFISYLNDVVMPDEPLSAVDDSSDDEAE